MHDLILCQNLTNPVNLKTAFIEDSERISELGMFSCTEAYSIQKGSKVLPLLYKCILLRLIKLDTRLFGQIVSTVIHFKKSYYHLPQSISTCASLASKNSKADFQFSSYTVFHAFCYSPFALVDLVFRSFSWLYPKPAQICSRIPQKDPKKYSPTVV